MRVKEIMTKDPACCMPTTTLEEVARAMCERDCGELPVVENETSLRPVGVITDRDIVCRSLAQGKNPLKLTAQDCMTAPAVTATPETSIEDACRLLEERQIRRIVVVDREQRCCGIVSQADIARKCEPSLTSEVVKEVSEPVAA